MDIFRWRHSMKRRAILTTALFITILIIYTFVYTQHVKKDGRTIKAITLDNAFNKIFIAEGSQLMQTHSEPLTPSNDWIEDRYKSKIRHVPAYLSTKTSEIAQRHFASTQPKNYATETDRHVTVANGTKSNIVNSNNQTKLNNIGKMSVSLERLACHFPELDPFHPSVLKKFFVSKTLECQSGLPSLVYRDGDVLKFNATRATINKLNIKNCTLTILKRSLSSDFKLTQSPSPKIFNTSIELPQNEEHFMTKCFDQEHTAVSRAYFSVIREKLDTENRSRINYQRHVRANSPKETLSVLFVGVDGVSRQSLIRSMNKTQQFIVNNLDAIQLYKFNKVGDNTFPNIVPLLTGMSKDELINQWPSQTKMDEVDHLFLWRKYEDAGYRTAMVVDRKRITAFHFLKSGWKRPTFDYYNRPVVLHTEDDLDLRTNWGCCIGQTPEVSMLLNYWIQLATVFNNTRHKPYFGFTHMNRLTHELSNRVSKADELYLEFFKTLQARKVLNNTLVIFFSDHGARFGPIRRTFNGILESRSPFAFLIFPDWFKNKYPEVTQTMRTNQHRLTTMFDIHETLKDLLKFQGVSKKASIKSRGISLFDEIPKERTCIHAGIPIEFCMCTNMTKVEASVSLSNKLANVMVQHIVKLTKDIRDKCEELTLNSVEAVAAVVDKMEKNPVYQIIIKTNPNKAVYEGILKQRSFLWSWSVQGLPVRLNLYRGQAECINSAKLRPFCYCKNRVNGIENEDDYNNSYDNIKFDDNGDDDFEYSNEYNNNNKRS